MSSRSRSTPRKGRLSPSRGLWHAESMSSEADTPGTFRKVDAIRARRDDDGVEVRIISWPTVEFARGERLLELYLHDTYQPADNGGVEYVEMLVWPNEPHWDNGEAIPPEEHSAIWHDLIEGMAALGSTVTVHAVDDASLLAGHS